MFGKILILFICLWSVPLPGLWAQSSQRENFCPFVLGRIDTFHSSVLKETRTVNIYLPEHYDISDTSKYPTIYLLDGSRNEDFIHIVGIVQFLTMTGAMPPTIVVGIANVDRRRDFTFPTTIAKDKKDFPTTGGSAACIKMIKTELLPYVKMHYNVNEEKTIIGQSLGGLLATEMLLKDPTLFDQYIIISPSLWWDNESLLTAAPRLLARHPPLQATVYISLGDEGDRMKKDDTQLLHCLEAAAGDRFKGYLVPLPDETHLTILHRAVYNALETLYAAKENK